MSTRLQLAWIHKRALTLLFTFEFHKWNMGKRDHRAKRGGGTLGLLHTVWPHRPLRRNNAWLGGREESQWCYRVDQQREKSSLSPENLRDFSTLTILTRCPGVAVMSQVHSLRLGYLSGQLGLLRVPLGLWILCSHSAGDTHTHTGISTHAHTEATHTHTHREEVKIIAAQEKGQEEMEKRTGRSETREAEDREKTSMKHILVMSSLWIFFLTWTHARSKKSPLLQ